jgi:hypothetical protein
MNTETEMTADQATVRNWLISRHAADVAFAEELHRAGSAIALDRVLARAEYYMRGIAIIDEGDDS